MNLKPLYDVVLVSAFGRSELLALELAQRGFKVAVLDLTSSFLKRGVDLRDVEGPFPMVTPSPSFPSHMDWMVAHSSGELDRGFSIWLKSGPVELRGPLSNYYSERDAAVSVLKEYLAKKLQSVSSKTLFGKQYGTLPFEENWLIHLAHSLPYSEMLMHRQSGYFGDPFPLNQSSQLLRLNDTSLSDLKASAIHAGVDYLENTTMESLVLEGRELRAIQLEGQKLLRSLFFGWSLSQEETFFLSPSVFKSLYNQEEPTLSDWKWQRIALETNQEHFQAMPDSFLMIENPQWFWSGENFVLFKKVDASQWDLWTRVPRHYPSPDRVVAQIQKYLEQRMGHFEGRLAWADSSKVSFFPIYEKGKRKSVKLPRLKNLVYEGVDAFERLDLSHRFQKQVHSLFIFETFKQRQEKMALKQERKRQRRSRDNQIHPS